MAKRLGLGKGLNALIPQGLDEEKTTLVDVDIDQIDPNPEQPRHRFDEQLLDELAASIKHNGVIQPIIITRVANRYQLIAGERRWRAAQRAGFTRIPAVVREIPVGERLTVALLENIQRQELNPIEEAMAYRNLLDQKDFTQETLAQNLGKSRASISNTIRLLKLPPSIQDMIEDTRLTFGHAKCLITMNHDEEAVIWAEKVVKEGWSVRELEKRLHQAKDAQPKIKPKKKDVFIKRAERMLSRCIGATVSIKGDEEKGKVVIPYSSQDELQRIYDWLTQQEEMED
ncbi:MAG: ParB/RepB/Spo0J family partition protein [Acidobacteria bacterium]|nr:ParB/RepB/Spo0J family partition protein [Acidobacteriota bacterium]